MHLAILGIVASAVISFPSPADAPVFEITPVEGSIKFDVETSVAIVGKFDRWDATLTFTSPDIFLFATFCTLSQSLRILPPNTVSVAEGIKRGAP
jgi:hypothetical protein